MSINKVYLPETDKLKEFLNLHGSTQFYFRYIRKRETFIGSSNSMKFIDKFIKKYESISTNFKNI